MWKGQFNKILLPQKKAFFLFILLFIYLPMLGSEVGVCLFMLYLLCYTFVCERREKEKLMIKELFVKIVISKTACAI